MADLEKKYNGKLTKKVNGKPLKTTITMGALAAEKKDDDLDIKIKIAPNDAVGELHLSVKGEGDEGAIDLYRGIHFKKTWPDEDYKRTLAQKIANTGTFSEAVLKGAGSEKPDGSDISDDVKMKKAQEVIDLVEKTKDPKAVPQWWGKKEKTLIMNILDLSNVLSILMIR